MSTSSPPRDRDPRSKREHLADYGRLAIYAVLTAVTVWFSMQLPEMAAAKARAETIDAEATDQRIRDICEKRGLGPRMHEYTLCTMDMKVRFSAEQRNDYISTLADGAAYLF